MKRFFLLIDGYNLMHAAGLARSRYAPGVLENCRHQLHVLLKKLLAEDVRHRTTIVYDAFQSTSTEQTRQEYHGISIRFAEHRGDADAQIEHLCAKHPSPRQLLIVSSDHRLQRAAQKRKSLWIDSEEFLEQIQSPDRMEICPTPHEDVHRLPHSCEIPPDIADELIRHAEETLANQDVTETPFPSNYLREVQREFESRRKPPG
ncbi:MAG: NYN domain-containing protein [Planctomycetaceae bacterium]|nr:NYN domain-containing protein [Planctomycetaceae bacterium]